MLSTLLSRTATSTVVALDEPAYTATHSHAWERELSALIAEVNQQFMKLEARVIALDEAVAMLQQPRDAELIGETELSSVWHENWRPSTLTASLAEISRRESVSYQNRQHETEALLASGFSTERIEQIRRLSEEAQVEREAAAHALLHSGQPLDAAAINAQIYPSDGLRAKMGDAEYERYLAALGRSTSVEVNRVLSGSPAATVQLRAGDEILTYGEERVYSLAELNASARERQPGESVVISVRRNGAIHQVVVPAGPLGVR